METPLASRPGRTRRLLPRGESLIASGGLFVGAVLLTVMGASTWWTQSAHRRTLESERIERVQAVGGLLASSSTRMLSDSPLSSVQTGVRTLVAEAALTHRLDVCRITLPDGAVIADADARKIKGGPLPETWTPSAPTEAATELTQGRVRMVFPLDVPGRGRALLEVEAAVDYPLWTNWEAQAGLGGITAGGLLALWAAYRAMRSRLRALGAIRESLRAAEAGETSAAVLAVSPEFGPDARAWNGLLADLDRLREQVQRDRAQDQMRSRGHRDGDLYNACDAMWQGLVIVDEKLRVKYANGAAAVFMRAKRDGLQDADITKLFDDPRVLEAVRAVATGQTRHRATVEVERGDRSTPGAGVLRFSVRPVRREDAGAAMVMIEDITQQRVADEARNAFVAQATHELRTPLTNIRLYVESLIDDEQSDPAERARCINVINQEARRLERIVADMLSVAEIEGGQLQLDRGDVRLQALFEELEADYRAQAQDKDIKLAFELPPKLPVMQGDRDKITLALHNLIGNALKYTPGGGSVNVRVDADASRLTVDVVDTGIGVREEEAELIFEKFYRAKDKRVTAIAGSGLGLALAREVARLHGGDITVRSQLDAGSTFTLSLPLAPTASARAAA